MALADDSERDSHRGQLTSGPELRVRPDADAWEEISELRTRCIAHDLNNMLGIVRASIDDWDRARTGDDSQLAVVRLALQRANRLVHALHPQSAEHDESVATNLDTELGELSPLLHRVADHMILDLEPGAAACWARLEAGEFERILVNLLSNSRDATNGKGHTIIRTRVAHATTDREGAVVPGDYVVLTVQDDGRGIPATLLPHLFEPFVTTRRTTGGLGLGLSIVHDIVQARGGFTRIESEVGVGTKIDVYLPRVQREPEPPRVSEVRLPKHQVIETIVVVDDEPLVLSSLSRVLRGQGYEVLEASSADDAIRLVRCHGWRIQLAFVDLCLGSKDGADVALHLRALAPHVGLVLMSGTVAPRGVPEGVQVLAKPMSLEDIETAIDRAARARS